MNSETINRNNEDDRPDLELRNLRIIEALIFASEKPVAPKDLQPYLSDMANIDALLEELSKLYKGRGVNLVKRGDEWAFRTADDLSFLLRKDNVETRPLSRASLETLSIIAYHQPTTRAEIEEVRGVSAGRGTLDILMEAGWIKMRGRRRTPGRPVTYGTTAEFLDHFSLESLADLPGLEELKGSGLLSNRLPSNIQIPMPFDGPLRDDEDPLDEFDDDEEE
ncbi:MAG: SMC-Scp complex subunit ScpB [Devosiaceae bacterium]|nr:SMC-Scp complex subunit ScpB [Devosiaceae bacterium]